MLYCAGAANTGSSCSSGAVLDSICCVDMIHLPYHSVRLACQIDPVFQVVHTAIIIILAFPHALFSISQTWTKTLIPSPLVPSGSPRAFQVFLEPDQSLRVARESSHGQRSQPVQRESPETGKTPYVSPGPVKTVPSFGYAARLANQG